MPVIDLGPVIGPQGPQGVAGATGAQGIQGSPGPNQVSSNTSTNLSGVLKGTSGSVGVQAVDAAPTSNSANLVTSGGVASGLSALRSAAANQNMLDNGYFLGSLFPVNQRRNALTSQSPYTSDGYALDRWIAKNAFGKVTRGSSEGLRYTRTTAGSAILLAQFLETAIPANTNVTLSALVRTSVSSGGVGIQLLDTSGITIANASATDTKDSASTSPHLLKVSGSFGTDIAGVSIFHGSATSVDDWISVEAIKLELGGAQTLAHQEAGSWALNEIPDYTTELLKCQRYLYVADGASTGLRVLGVVMPISTSKVVVNMRYPVPMRDIPTVNVASVAGYLRPDPSSSSGSINISSAATGNFLSPLQCTLVITADGTLTMGTPYVAVMNNASYKVIASAEPIYPSS